MASSTEPHPDRRLTSITAPTMSTQSKWARPEDWDKYKNTIQALFMMHSLSNVMRIMRDDHDFHATAKMYNVHIYQKWGMRKGRVESKDKKKRKRREGTADAESVASSTRQPGYANTIGDEPEVTPQVAPPPQAHPYHPVPNASTGYHQLADPGIINAPVGAYGQLPWDPCQPEPVQTDASVVSRGPATNLQPPMSYGDGIAPSSAYALHDGSAQPYEQQQQMAFQPSSHPQPQAQVQNMASRHETMPLHPVPNSPPRSTTSRGTGFTWDAFLGEEYPAPQTAAPVLEQNAPASDGGRSSSSHNSWMSAVLGRPSDGSVTSHPSGAPSTAPKSRASGTSGKSKKSFNSWNSETSSRASRVSEDQASSTSDQSRSTASTISLHANSLRHLEAPSVLLLPESSMFYARHYISSAFATGLWTLSQNSDMSLIDTECVKLDKWYNDFNPGQEMLNHNNINEAFRIFKICFAETKTVIEVQDPRIVIYICQQAMRFMYYDRLGRVLAQCLLRYTAGLCKEIFGVGHPLHMVMDQLSKMDNFEFALCIRPLLDCYFDHLEPFLESKSKAYGFVNELRGLSISLMEACGVLGVYEAKPILDRLTERAAQNGQPTLFLTIELASILARGRFFQQSIDMLDNVRTYENGVYHPYEYTYAGIMLMVTYRKMKDLQNSIRVGYELAGFLMNPPRQQLPAFETELSAAHRQSTLTLLWSKLEKDHRDSGQLEEAMKIKARINNIYDEVYGVEEDPSDTQTAAGAFV